MSSDYGHLEIDGFDIINGVAVPYYKGESSVMGTPCHHYLDWNDIRDGEARQLTSPYGSLSYAVGTGDDFHCFDWAWLPDGRMILHSTVNSETGGFCDTASYEVVWPEAATEEAVNVAYAALDWLCEGGDRCMRHTTRGWNQDPFYFARCVARAVRDPRIAWWRGSRICRSRPHWHMEKIIPGNPEIVRLDDPSAIVLRFHKGSSTYDSEPIGMRPEDNVFQVALDYMRRYGWDSRSPA